MKLVYWIARVKDDSACYSLRAKTRKELRARLADPKIDAKRYATPVKVTVEYRDAFDLADKLLGEGGESMYYREPEDLYETEDEEPG